MVEEVVRRRDGREHLAHVAGASRPRARSAPAGGAVTARATRARRHPQRRLPDACRRRKTFASLSDQEVVALARAGKEAAYRELLRRYERPVFSLIYRMVRDRAAAEDLAQETFIKVLNALDSYRPEFKFSSWIFKIANNAAIDHLRRRELDTLSLDGAPDARTADEIEATALQATDRGPIAPRRPRVPGAGLGHRAGHRQAPPRVPLLHPPAARRGTGLRGDRRNPRPASGHGQDLHPPGPPRAPRVAGPPQGRLKPVPEDIRMGYSQEVGV